MQAPLKCRPFITAAGLVLYFTVACSGIQNREDLAEAESDLKQGDRERLEEVEEVAKGSAPGLETRAVEVIGDIPGSQARNTLVRLSKDKNRSVRRSAMKELGDRKEQDTGQLLLKTLQDEKKREPEGLVSLGKLREAKAVPLLKKEAATPQRAENQPAAIEALGLIGNTDSRAALHEIIKSDAGTEKRVMALTALSRNPNAQDRQVLSNVAESNKYSTAERVAAIESLGRIGDESVSQSLSELYYRSDGDLEIKKAVIAARARIENKSENEILSDMRRKIWADNFADLKRKKPRRPAYLNSKLSMRDRVIKAAGGFSAAGKIDKALSRLSNMDSAAADLTYKSYLQVYPNLSFGQIQLKMRQGLRNPRPFRNVLRNISKQYPNDALRILALRNMFQLSASEATGLYNAFKQGRI